MSDKGGYKQFHKGFDWDDYRDACDWDAQSVLNLGHESIEGNGAPDDALALVWRGADGTERRFTFGDLRDASDLFAGALRELGVEAGDRVFTHLPRIPEHYFSVLGTLKTGALFGAVNERYGVDGLAHRLDDSGARVVLTSPTNLEKVREAAPASVEELVIVDRNGEGVPDDCTPYADLIAEASTNGETYRTAPDDPALLYYTSGTTGPAKGVVHGHQFTVGNAAFSDIPADVGEGDLYWVTADLGWLTGLNALGVWFWGHPIVSYEGAFDTKRWATILDELPVTVLWSVPTAYRMLETDDGVLDDADLSIQNLVSIGEPLNASVIEWAEERFDTPILDGYGSSEAYGTVVSNYPFMEVKPGSMGRPYGGIDVRLVEPNTLDPAEGDIGEIAVREFPSSFLEYWNRPEKTAKTRRDGWILTEDLAKRDEDGYFWFQGRADDVILSAGYRIGPFDIESTLVAHPGVAEAAVVPAPHEERGNIVKAFVVRSPEGRETANLRSTLQSHVRERLAAHEYPREIEFVEELPQTVTGKIRRKELRECD
jgi:acetyl-CoA synthetase